MIAKLAHAEAEASLCRERNDKEKALREREEARAQIAGATGEVSAQLVRARAEANELRGKLDREQQAKEKAAAAAVVASEQAAKRTEELGQAKSALAVLTSENHKHEKQLAKEKEKAAKAKEGLKQSTAERGELEAKLVAATAAAAAAEARCEELQRSFALQQDKQIEQIESGSLPPAPDEASEQELVIANLNQELVIAKLALTRTLTPTLTLTLPPNPTMATLT